jgi:threonine/homoserine/homoserine lactone efflux protein
LPQFLSAAHPLTPQLCLLAGTFVAMATLNAALYAVFAGAARTLMASAHAQRRFNLVGGSLLTGAGVWALLARRAA